MMMRSILLAVLASAVCVSCDIASEEYHAKDCDDDPFWFDYLAPGSSPPYLMCDELSDIRYCTDYGDFSEAWAYNCPLACGLCEPTTTCTDYDWVTSYYTCTTFAATGLCNVIGDMVVDSSGVTATEACCGCGGGSTGASSSSSVADACDGVSCPSDYACMVNDYTNPLYTIPFSCILIEDEVEEDECEDDAYWTDVLAPGSSPPYLFCNQLSDIRFCTDYGDFSAAWAYNCPDACGLCGDSSPSADACDGVTCPTGYNCMVNDFTNPLYTTSFYCTNTAADEAPDPCFNVNCGLAWWQCFPDADSTLGYECRDITAYPLLCAYDVMLCDDGSSVNRDGSNGCAFFPCPSEPSCTDLDWSYGFDTCSTFAAKGLCAYYGAGTKDLSTGVSANDACCECGGGEAATSTASPTGSPTEGPTQAPTTSPAEDTPPTDTDTEGCTDDPSFDLGFGDCTTYQEGLVNHSFCEGDGAVGVCCGCSEGTTQAPTTSPAPTDSPTQAPTTSPAPTDTDTEGCTDDPSFDIGFGDCTTYQEGLVNHSYCEGDGAVGVCCGCSEEDTSPDPSPTAECTDDLDFDVGFGDCSTYYIDKINYKYCTGDGAVGVCCGCDDDEPAEECTSDPTFDAGFGDCSTYEVDGGINFVYCEVDSAVGVCCACGDVEPAETETASPECTDDLDFNAGYGDCSTYEVDVFNHAYCESDGAVGFCCGCTEDADDF